jgi:predicted nucleic acid-binding protein
MNAVASAVRRQRVGVSRGEEFTSGLGSFDILIHRSPDSADFLRLFRLSQRHGLTAYDVAYLDLSIRLAIPLATLDGDLRRAALAEQLEVIGQ